MQNLDQLLRSDPRVGLLTQATNWVVTDRQTKLQNDSQTMENDPYVSVYLCRQQIGIISLFSRYTKEVTALLRVN